VDLVQAALKKAKQEKSDDYSYGDAARAAFGEYQKATADGNEDAAYEAFKSFVELSSSDGED